MHEFFVLTVKPCSPAHLYTYKVGQGHAASAAGLMHEVQLIADMLKMCQSGHEGLPHLDSNLFGSYVDEHSMLVHAVRHQRLFAGRSCMQSCTWCTSNHASFSHWWLCRWKRWTHRPPVQPHLSPTLCAYAGLHWHHHPHCAIHSGRKTGTEVLHWGLG